MQIQTPISKHRLISTSFLNTSSRCVSKHPLKTIRRPYYRFYKCERGTVGIKSSVSRITMTLKDTPLSKLSGESIPKLVLVSDLDNTMVGVKSKLLYTSKLFPTSQILNPTFTSWHTMPYFSSFL